MGVGEKDRIIFKICTFLHKYEKKKAPTLGMRYHTRQLRNVPFTPLCAKFQGPFVLNHPATLTEVAQCPTLT